MPNGLGIGVELEVSSGGRQALAILGQLGVTTHNRFHGYHCGCDECEYNPADKKILWGAQQDCTADGEFISKVLTYGSKRMHDAFKSLSTALVDSGAEVTGNVGNHVHVRRPTDRRRVPTDVKLAKLFTHYQDELEDFAAASFGRVRGYNSKNRPVNGLENIKPWRYARNQARSDNYYSDRYTFNNLANGSWLRIGAGGCTYEFRLWNASKSAWRLELHAGMSVAMVRAAMYGSDKFHENYGGKPILEALAPWMDDATVTNAKRQLAFRASR